MPGDAREEHEPPRTLAAKIERCFEVMHPADRGPWTLKEVSQGMADLGVTCSVSYLSQLRHGDKDNPTLRQVQALAKFFHVPMTYFVGTDDEVDNFDAQMVLVEARRTNPELQDIALRTANFTSRGVLAIAAIVRELEGIPGMSKPTTKRARAKSPAPSPEDD